jgi:hypothetical protein
MTLPPFINSVVKWSFVYLNDRLQPNESRLWTIPEGRVFILTDLVAQNRGQRDVPVKNTDFTRLTVTSPGNDVVFTVVGNGTLNLHFQTGLPIAIGFRLLNMGNSTAPFVEVHITGRLRSAD